MQVLGRILQVVGWLWVAAGFFGPALNLPFDLNFFPGIILVFISRILRAQAARYGGDEEEPVTPASTRQPVEVQRPAPRPQPERRPRPEPREAETTSADAEANRQEMLEQILITGTEVAEEEASPAPEAEPAEIEETDHSGSSGPMSSAEMIAQARKRWNKS